MPCATPCSIGAFIESNCKPLIQLATHRLPEYNMRNDSTKCLNSAVMLAYLLFGETALQYTSQCDVENVKTRYRLKDRSLAQAKQLAKELKRPGSEPHVLYVMLTDGNMPRSDDSSIKMYEPGHVFLIERFGGDACKDRVFDVYQSYINAYDLDEYAMKARNQPRDQAFLDYIADSLVHLFSVPTWDERCSTFWKTFTQAAGDQFEGYDHHGVMMLCYVRLPLASCSGDMRRLLTEALVEADAAAPDDVFGDATKYKSVVSAPLTNGQMAQHLREMLARF